MPRVGGALSARSRQYQGTAASMSNAAKLGIEAKVLQSRLATEKFFDRLQVVRFSLMSSHASRARF